MMPNLSEHETKLIEYLEQRFDAGAGVPSFEEMRSALSLTSKDHVFRLLDTLENKNYIQRQRGQSRSLTLLRTTSGRPYHLARIVRVPLLAIAPASFGQDVYGGFDPNVAENPNSYLDLTRDLVADETGIYALRVRGDSMIDAFIHDGDIVVLHQQEEARNGDLVQAWVHSDESPTIKRYFRDGSRIRLQPENSRLKPRFFAEEDVRIQGKVVLVIRSLERRLAA